MDEMNDNKLAIYNQYDQMERAAVALQKSGYFKDVVSQAQAIVKVMAGAELGLPPFASMSGIFIIQGKPVLGANILATLVKNDPRYDYKVKICTHLICTLTWFEDGKQVGESTFTIEEAKTAGLTDKDNWRKFPSDMLFARAISRGARRFAPGIFGGSPVYTPDEMGVDVNEEGMIDAVMMDSEPVEPPSNGNMTLEEALAVTDSHGKTYGLVSDAGLYKIQENIEAKLKEPLDANVQDGYLRKLQAIKLILDSRNIPVTA
jgi:hypothetical protein